MVLRRVRALQNPFKSLRETAKPEKNTPVPRIIERLPHSESFPVCSGHSKEWPVHVPVESALPRVNAGQILMSLNTLDDLWERL